MPTDVSVYQFGVWFCVGLATGSGWALGRGDRLAADSLREWYMSKLGKLGSFFKKVGQVAPAVLVLTPLAPIAPIVQAAIQEAEAIPGATGAQKRAHVKAIAVDAATSINIAKGAAVVDVAEVEQAADSSITAVIDAVNVAKDNDDNPDTPV